MNYDYSNSFIKLKDGNETLILNKSQISSIEEFKYVRGGEKEYNGRATRITMMDGRHYNIYKPIETVLEESKAIIL